MRECVIIDGVRSANSRRTSKRDGFRAIRPDEFDKKFMMGCLPVTQGKNLKISRPYLSAVPILPACRTISAHFLVGRRIPGICSLQHPYKHAFRHGCHWACCQSYCMREGRYLPGFRVETCQKVFMAMHMDFPPRLLERYTLWHPMFTAEKWLTWEDHPDDMETWPSGHKKADEATKVANSEEISRLKGLRTWHTLHGPYRPVDSWDISREQMATISPVQTRWFLYRRHVLTAYRLAQPLDFLNGTLQGRQAGTFLSPQIWRRCHGRLRSDHHGYRSHSAVKGSGPKGMKVSDIDLWNSTRLCQSGFSRVGIWYRQNAPFDNVKRLGRRLRWHPLGESGCRLVVTWTTSWDRLSPSQVRCGFALRRFRQRQCL